MKSMCRLFCMMMWFPLVAFSQPRMETSSVEPFSIRTLNTYEVLDTPTDLANHPLMNVEVTFTAVVSGIANNTGLPASNAALVPGLARRLHLFVIDTMAAEFGNYGMSMQIVEDLNSDLGASMADVLMSARRGSIYTFTGQLTIFGTQIQFDLTQVPIPVGDVNLDPQFEHLRTVLDPHFVHSFMLNQLDSLTGALVPNMEMYTGMAHSYVTLGMVQFTRYSSPAALRPEWAASDPFGLVYLYDSSSRFRNDRQGLYGDIMNHRRLGLEDAFTPPETGAMGEISGFVVYGNTSVQGLLLPTMAMLAPWYDGVLWNTMTKTTPDWMPTDLVVDTTAVPDNRTVEFRVTTADLMDLGLFDPMFDVMYVRGSFNGWETIRMTPDGWGEFTTNVSISGQEGDTIAYKFFYERPGGANTFNGGWEIIGDDPSINRIALLGPVGVKQTLESMFGVGQTTVNESRLISFFVDMTPLIQLGYFDPTFDTKVSIAGSFSGWGTLPMQRLDNTVWGTTINMPGAQGDTIEYKFVYERVAGPIYNYGYEIIDARELLEGIYVNRTLVLGPADVPVVLDMTAFGVVLIDPPASELVFPITAEETDIPWVEVTTNFEGGELIRVANPDTSAANPSGHVLRLVKNPGMPWAGAYLTMSNAFQINMMNAFKVNVLAPRAGSKLLLKLENEADASIYAEREVVIPVANQWTELTFDFSDAMSTNLYKKVVLIYDLGTIGNGGSEFTMYIDDIRPAVVVPHPTDLIPVYMYTTSRFAPGDGDGNWLYIGLGDEDTHAEELIGMGFSLSIDTVYAVPTAYTTLGLFDDGSDEDYLDLVQLDLYSMGASIVRTSGTNKLPYGPVFGFRFNVKSDIEWLNIGIYDIEIRNANGDLVPFELRTPWIEIPTRSQGVWPGDANADGTVDVFDVDPIGFYFGTTGPARTNRSIQWMMMDASIWNVYDAVYADGNGDGIVNQNDLLPVGFNFGKTVPGPVAKQLAELPELASPESFTLPLPAMRRGQQIEIPLYANRSGADVLNLRSVGLRLSLDNDLVTVRSATPPSWFTDPAMLKLVRNESAQNRFSAAFARTRDMDAVSGPGAVITLLVEANTDLSYGQAQLTIDRALLGFDSDRAMPVRLVADEGTITSVDDPRATVPTETRLEGNFPNPFNPSTVIAYALANDATTRLSVFDVLGREVAVLVDAHQSAGSYQVVFDASGLSSGMYLIRLQAGTETFIKRMTLVK